MRSYKAVILEAELLASPPKAVADFLKQRAERLKGERFNDDVDERFEAALRERDDPLISLALAKHGQFGAVAKPLFESGSISGAIRLAVLSNATLSSELFSRFPVALFGSPEKAAEWLVGAPAEEVSALFENPGLDNGFLRDLLEGAKPFDAIGQEQLALFVATLARNERMRTPYDDKHMDGYAEYSHGAVFDAAWKLAGTAPATERWAMALSWLYDRLRTDAFSIDKPLDLAPRWIPDPADTELVEKDAEEVERGWLSHHQGVRKGLGRLALRKDSKLFEALLASDDPALRSAAYADGSLSPEQIGAAYHRDGELAFNQAMHNQSLWRTALGRDALRKVAWAVVHNDKHSDLSAANIYNGIRDDFAKSHPDWFKEDDSFSPEPSDEPATKADVQALDERLAQASPGTGVEQLTQALGALNSRVGWVWWFSLGALVASLWRR